jgi:hypothetical protein
MVLTTGGARWRAVLLAVGLGAGLVTGADAVPAPYTVLQLNVCNSGASCTLPGTARHAGELIATRRPSVVTVNEICASDLATIRRLSGYDGAFVQAGEQTCMDETEGSDGVPYGNAVLFPPGTSVHDVRGVEYGAQTQATERRSLACATGDGVTACATHLACDRKVPQLREDDRRIRAAQAEQMRVLVDELAGRGPVVLGGDWNLVAGGVPDARAFVPAGTVHVDDGDVQHVLASATDFRPGRAEVLALDWTDHPALEVRYARGPLGSPRS